jgi:abortive infection bacteriophage resistance protein
MKFLKPAISLDDQIQLLERRGMMIASRDRARHYLGHVSYYRLRAYWLPFEMPAESAGEHKFVDGTTFEQVLALYVFDRRLRLLVLDAIERIEVSIRGHWAHHLAMTYGAHGYLEPALYDRQDWHIRSVSELQKTFDQSKDTFADHYRDKYGDPPLPPIWMTAELISLGQLSKWITNLKLRADRQALARPYGIDEKVLGSFIYHAAHIRNICAHHGRLWNKRFTVTMLQPRAPRPLASSLHAPAGRNIYNTLTTIAYMLGIIAPDASWQKRLAQLINTPPLVDIGSMGFPAGWQLLPIWSGTTALSGARP